MSRITNANPQSILGFLTVVDHPQYGLFGGYLILNTAGRPLEFHCTAPIKPNRAQEILYGPTLQPFLYGEQIGHTLVEHAKGSPMLICTDRKPALAVREHVSMPVILVLPHDEAVGEQTPEEGPADQVDRILRLDSIDEGPRLSVFSLGRNRLALPEQAENDRRLVAERLGELGESFDLVEPFQRIRDAIEEAQQTVR